VTNRSALLHKARSVTLLLVCISLATFFAGSSIVGARESGQKAGQVTSQEKHGKFMADRLPPQRTEPMAETPCVDGFAGEYPCENIDLMAFVPIGSIGGGSAADLWGWTDRLTGVEYALLGRSNGTSFVDISDPANPVYIGNLPTNAASTSWRDVDVYRDHAFIVCDLCGNHGMQVFDLTRLRNVPNPPVTFDEDALYEGFDTSHTVNINTRTGFAYATGSNTCSGGLHIVNVQDPLNPVMAGCYSGDGYTHEAQCVIYRGPDVEHRDDEICFASNEDTLTIVDVTNKSAPVMLAREPYAGASYTHQGWLTPNHRIFVLDDELDELFNGHNTRTRFFDVADLENPFVTFTYTATTDAIDHQQYVRGRLVYQSNYRAGVRIISPPSTEVAFFDVWPSDDAASFNGTWGNYPFFRSGIVIASHIEDGLFVLRPTLNQKDFSAEWMR
jgi:choice-of-anchor B domain-containing protein